MGREFELKYEANRDVLEILKQRYPHLAPISMETTYYDTPGGHMGKLLWTFRRRMENGKSVITLKTPAGGHGRNEWETECDDLMVGVERLAQNGAPAQIMAFAARDGFVPCCGAKFTRLAGLLEIEGATVEIALDEGTLLGGGRVLPFIEVEVELKAGSEEAAVLFGERIAKELNLKPQPRSKVARARKLAGL